MKTVWTMGYQGRKLGDIIRVVKDHDAVLADIRYKAYSPNPQFRGGHLASLLGEQYAWLKGFGNSLYKAEGNQVALSDYPEALGKLRGLLERYNVILMCACRDYASCHRHVVADMLSAELGQPVEEIPFNEPPPPADDEGPRDPTGPLPTHQTKFTGPDKPLQARPGKPAPAMLPGFGVELDGGRRTEMTVPPGGLAFKLERQVGMWPAEPGPMFREEE